MALPTIREVCVPRAEIFDAQLADWVLSIRKFAEGRYEPAWFFNRTVITKTIARLNEMVIKRLKSGSGEGIIILSESMGGGKTHVQIALGLLAQHPEYRAKLFPQRLDELGPIRTVVFDGYQSDNIFWQEVARQVGSTHPKLQTITPPGPTTWIEALKGIGPTIILIDELPAYLFATRNTSAGDLSMATASALVHLYQAISAGDLPNICVVQTSLMSSSFLLGKEANDLDRMLTDLPALTYLSQETTNKLAQTLAPVGSPAEFAEILRLRLFERIDYTDRDEVINAYLAAIKQAGRDDAYAALEIRERWRESYPFHPALFETLKKIELAQGFQQTRGILRLLARAVAHAFKEPTDQSAKESTDQLSKEPTSQLGRGAADQLGKKATDPSGKEATNQLGREPAEPLGKGSADPLSKAAANPLELPDPLGSQLLIGPCELDPGYLEIREEYEKINEKFMRILDKDVAHNGTATAELIDAAQRPGAPTAARAVARLVFLASLAPTGERPGLTVEEIGVYAAAPAPDRSADAVLNAIGLLADHATFLHTSTKAEAIGGLSRLFFSARQNNRAAIEVLKTHISADDAKDLARAILGEDLAKNDGQVFRAAEIFKPWDDLRLRAPDKTLVVVWPGENGETQFRNWYKNMAAKAGNLVLFLTGEPGQGADLLNGGKLVCAAQQHLDFLQKEENKDSQDPDYNETAGILGRAQTNLRLLVRNSFFRIYYPISNTLRQIDFDPSSNIPIHEQIKLALADQKKWQKDAGSADNAQGLRNKIEILLFGRGGSNDRNNRGDSNGSNDSNNRGDSNGSNDNNGRDDNGKTSARKAVRESEIREALAARTEFPWGPPQAWEALRGEMVTRRLWRVAEGFISLADATPVPSAAVRGEWNYIHGSAFGEIALVNADAIEIRHSNGQIEKAHPSSGEDYVTIQTTDFKLTLIAIDTASGVRGPENTIDVPIKIDWADAGAGKIRISTIPAASVRVAFDGQNPRSQKNIYTEPSPIITLPAGCRLVSISAELQEPKAIPFIPSVDSARPLLSPKKAYKIKLPKVNSTGNVFTQLATLATYRGHIRECYAKIAASGERQMIFQFNAFEVTPEKLRDLLQSFMEVAGDEAEIVFFVLNGVMMRGADLEAAAEAEPGIFDRDSAEEAE